MRQRPFLVVGLLLLVGAVAAFFVGFRERAAPPGPPYVEGEDVDGVPGPRLHGRTPPRKAASRVDGATESGAGTARITGRVLLPGGGPAPYASVRYADSLARWSVASTDEAGRFILERGDGPCPPIVATAPQCGYGVAPGPHLKPFETRDVGTLQLTAGHVIEGRVVDEDGAPLADIDVALWTEAQPVPPGWSGMWIADEAWSGHETDEEGRFAFHRLPPGSYWVRAHAHDRTGGEQVREHVPAGTTTLSFVLTPEDDEETSFTFRVIAIGPDGTRIPEFDADLTAYTQEAGTQGSAEEPAAMELEGGRPPYRILVYDPRGADSAPLGYAPFLLDDVTPRREPYIVRMEEEGLTVKGRVVWEGPTRTWTVCAWGEIAADGRSVVDQVHVLPALPDFLIRAESDASGAFEIRGLPPGHVALSLGFNDRSVGRIRGGGQVVDAGTEGVVLEVQPAATLHLVVRSPAGTPIDRATIRLYERHAAACWLANKKTVHMASASGATWKVAGLDPDARFRVVAEGTWKGALVGRSVLDSARPRETPYVLALEPGPQVSGSVVTPDGKGVADATVRLYRSEGGSWRRLLSTPGRAKGVAYTDREGRFTIRAPSGGRYFVVAVAPGLTPLPAPPLVEGGARDVQVVLHPRLSIRGRLHAPAGDALPAFRVTALPATEEAGLWRETLSMGNGFFDVPDLAAGSYRIVAWPKEDDDDRYARSAPVEAGASDLRLVVRRGCTLEGQVVTDRGLAVPWADVRLEGAWTRRFVDADENGHYRIGGLAPGPCTVSASTPGGNRGKAAVRLSGGRNAVDIVMPSP